MPAGGCRSPLASWQPHYGNSVSESFRCRAALQLGSSLTAMQRAVWDTNGLQTKGVLESLFEAAGHIHDSRLVLGDKRLRVPSPEQR